MTTTRTFFYLTVTRIQSVCQFELQGQGQKITEQVDYPLSLTQNYEDWQKAYLDYYQHIRGRKTINHLQKQELTNMHLRGWKVINKNLRGRKVISGVGKITVDRNKQLKDAEAQLLDEFHRWLLSPDLVNIRREIANAARKLSDEQQSVEVFLTCNPIEIARLPWETWEIGTDLGIPEKIQIYRTPATIRNQPVRPLQRKARILAIIGYDTSLNFEADQQEVESLKSIAEVEFVGWNTKTTKVLNPENATELKTQIFHAINDERGWDILFFAGHSNETILTGGELGVAPNVSLAIQDIEEVLKKAQTRGLQFAIFNSCSGINIAESLINLGLSQVVVMREPIHNQVARKFLVQFLRSLVGYKDVHQALLDACQYLKQQVTRFSYPSAYLVPSLYRHPDAELFRLKSFGFWNSIKKWLPKPKNESWLLLLLLISLLPNVQDFLLDKRIWLQAFYRQFTYQIPKDESPLFLVKIDNKSINQDKIKQPYPLDYGYLANIIQKLSQANSKLIGVDYILDQGEQQKQKSKKLNQAIRAAVSQESWFVFGALYPQDETSLIENSKETVTADIANLHWSIAGDINITKWYVELPSNTNCSHSCPFSYLLALSYFLQHQKSLPPNLPKPKLSNQNDFRDAIIKSIISQNTRYNFLQNLRLHPLFNFQQFFQPILDFSIPPTQIYKSVSACELLGSCESEIKIPNNLKNKVVMIVPAGYEEAGIKGKGEDNETIPSAISFWNGWGEGIFSRSAAHAYMVHHLLKQRLVVPIPDFFIILLSAFLGKALTVRMLENSPNKPKIFKRFWGILVIYLIISLQIYTSAAILLPCFFPSVTLWNYIRITTRRNVRE
ncbi:putative Chase2 sensor protein [Tolypothrix tenuis PCC 7101]|uniref:Putative Chase2 sensor protein n=1 Tax=Tolypothrix tenuis PCC 7101 TaxID=231146 RepID=A0A1Z4N8R1_9CYAN|nr:CHASE2 domain-containing protein [Aulosira sp. FACHB-113]BAZ02080.1 putative Chase2 sensor protein [Tolypothrix tenuis PCC 7101]BAZ73997.1 putative Chase2 sensor protein [Aulosira laxa NIES-50]